MKVANSKITVLLPLLCAALSACGAGDSQPAASAAAEGVELATLTPTTVGLVQPTNTMAPTATVTPVPSPTATPVPSPLPVTIRVSENTNCRSGPASTFEFLGGLSVGEQTEIVGRSAASDYWYVVNPDDPEGLCWLWGAFATVEGQTESLPVVTAEPSPTPYVGFDIWFHGFEPCGGSQTAIFAIRNAGAVRLWSGWVAVYAMDPLDDLYGPARERHPFADTAVPACPPGHGNELYPGEVRYIHAPLSNVPHTRDAYAEVTLCSGDHGGGDCVTKIGYFYIP